MKKTIFSLILMLSFNISQSQWLYGTSIAPLETVNPEFLISGNRLDSLTDSGIVLYMTEFRSTYISDL